jgi:hypothetical protein
MSTVYATCTSETGKGQYKRMKDYMRDHVEHERHHMFNEAVKTVEKHLDAMCKALQESMEAKADEIFVQMNRDYMRVLGGIASDQPIRVQSREEAKMKSEIRDVLGSVDTQFEAIVNGDFGSQDVTRDDTRAQDEKPIDVEDEDESGVFDSAQEFVDNDADDAPAKRTIEHDSNEQDGDEQDGDKQESEQDGVEQDGNGEDVGDDSEGEDGPPTPADDDEMDEEM